MGVDLSLIVENYPGIRIFLGVERLILDRDYELQGHIKKLDAKLLPKTIKFIEYSEEPAESSQTDPYGQPLRTVTASQIASIRYTPQSAKNKAVLAYMRALPKKTKILLWWH